ncbi:MAG TPA: HAMP domain-containing protein [Lentisphaerae bacterium]|nr:HAMP domain-containing protein [Lentisphaerota bacterium]
MMYVAMPVMVDGETAAVLRTSTPLSAIDRELANIRTRIVLGSLGAVLLSAVLCFLVSRRISGPLEELTRGAERFARGDMSHRLHISRSSSTEVIILAEMLNRMAAELDRRIRAVEEQRNELDAVLSSMSEGVLAVDCEGRVVVMNEAAARLLAIGRTDVGGRLLEEVVKDATLQELVNGILATQEPAESEIVLRGDREVFLRAHGVPLRSAGEDGTAGAIVVFSDITRLRQVERLRRDFVANVSHELKTPVTAIKGFVETLLNGAVHDGENVERFLRIIARHADRMGRIIEDLLTLSRLEQQAGEAAVEFEPVPLAEVIHAAVQACAPSAERRGIEIRTSIDEGIEGITVTGNPELLEQAVINLVDNAVKYSATGSHVHVELKGLGAEAVISIRDHGCGIDKEHLPRLFERFYRVDPARSRALGGTGLGLSIVKHIVLAHGGNITVDSAIGRGTTFTLRLPKA